MAEEAGRAGPWPLGSSSASPAVRATEKLSGPSAAPPHSCRQVWKSSTTYNTEACIVCGGFQGNPPAESDGGALQGAEPPAKSKAWMPLPCRHLPCMPAPLCSPSFTATSPPAPHLKITGFSKPSLGPAFPTPGWPRGPSSAVPGSPVTEQIRGGPLLGIQPWPASPP